MKARDWLAAVVTVGIVIVAAGGWFEEGRKLGVIGGTTRTIPARTGTVLPSEPCIKDEIFVKQGKDEGQLYVCSSTQRFVVERDAP